MTTDEIIKNLGEMVKNELIKFDYDYELFHPLINGYCFYFAIFLKFWFPNGTILFTNKNHYIFLLDGIYYDYRGKMIETEREIFLYISEDNEPVYVDKDKLIEVTDIESELAYSLLWDADALHKQYIWNQVLPYLKETAGALFKTDCLSINLNKTKKKK